ncbi:unnamed protein product [Dovyalis caffra]|uniref:FAD linked oxidase N-terminal domain-containing protein n=1 Tax=Dovyalis caffra TaxID=77055 RepID=A0AAV1QRN9_9ROSI|nr:unnamed protein product [Dovyalis caffra]
MGENQLASALRYCHQHSIRRVVVGKGSNCLFDNLVSDGCVILNRIEFLDKIQHGVYRVGSGFRFYHLGVQCCNEGFTGLEFAGGIPGTVGGATYMNGVELMGRVGGAMISYIHANFFINADGSTSQNMLELIALAKEKVDQKFGVQLKEEIIHVHTYCDGLIHKRDKQQAI